MLAVPFLVLANKPNAQEPAVTLAPSPSATPAPSTPPTMPPDEPSVLPSAPGEPSALADPSRVGADPALLHLDVPTTALPKIVDRAYDSQPGVETVELAYGEPDDYAAVIAGRDEATVEESLSRHNRGAHTEVEATYQKSVNGVPATVHRYARGRDAQTLTGALEKDHRFVVRWEPVAGLKLAATLRSTDDRNILALAAAVRLDRALRCAQPVHATVFPPGGQLSQCYLVVTTAEWSPTFGKWSLSTYEWKATDGGALSVEVRQPFTGERTGKDIMDYNRTAAGKPAQWKYNILEVPMFLNRYDLRILTDGTYSDTDAIAVANGMRATGDPKRPETWAHGPLG